MVIRLRLLLLIALVIALVVTALLVPIPFHGRLATALGDLVHAPLFGTLAFAALAVWQSRSRPTVGADASLHQNVWPTARRCLVVFLLLTSFGLLMESAQSQFGRTGSAHDALANSLGVIAASALFLGLQFRQRKAKAVSLALIGLSIAILIGAWSRPLLMIADVDMMKRQFPLIGSFESSAELSRWYCRENRCQLTRSNVTDGSHAMEIHYVDRQEPFITLIDLVPDWSGYRQLEFDVTLDKNSSVTRCRAFAKVVNEELLGRYSAQPHREFEVQRGMTRRIALQIDQSMDGQEMDLTQMRFVDLGIEKPSTDVILRVDRMRLVK